jgi:hypothetical protein
MALENVLDWEGPGWYEFVLPADMPGGWRGNFWAPLQQPENVAQYGEATKVTKIPDPRFLRGNVVIHEGKASIVQMMSYHDVWLYCLPGRSNIPESELSTIQDEIDRRVEALLDARVKKAVEDALAAMFPIRVQEINPFETQIIPLSISVGGSSHGK